LPQNPENPIVELPAMPTLITAIETKSADADAEDEDDEEVEDKDDEDDDDEDDDDEENDEDAEDDDDEENDAEVHEFQSTFVVSTENGESLQFLSFIENGENKITISMNGNITLPIDTLTSYLDEIDSSLKRSASAAASAAKAEEADARDLNLPAVINYLLTFFVILIYSGTVSYAMTIAMNAPL